METNPEVQNTKTSFIPKYGAYFLAFIIISKIIYLGVEVFYNGYLIDIITSASVTQESLEYIESLGHNVSSVGLTLLVLPFFYLLYRKFITAESKVMIATLTGITLVILFFVFHSLLASLMDKIVEDNKSKRYTSYYISAFKYGMLNGSLGYESFMPKSHLKNPTIEDKVILSNIFLLNFIDEKLIDKFVARGQDQFADVFILKYGHDDYIKAENKFETEVSSIVDGYNKYLNKSKEINEKFSKLDNAMVLDAEYQDFTGKLRQKYADYEKKVIAFERSVNLSDSKRNKTYNKLKKYFDNQGYSQAKRRYKAEMNRKFGHYITPSRWCNGGYCPSNRAIDQVVYTEGYRKFIKKTGGIPPDLGQRAFYKHTKVKKRVISELKAKGLRVPNSFNYSKAQFASAYKAKINREFSKVKKKFSAELKQETGKYIQFGLNYNQFVYKFKSDFTKEVGKKWGQVLYTMAKAKDTSKFYSKFYKPKYKDEYLRDFLLTKSDFNGDKHKELGDGSVKHLFIPPFAIGMSLIAGILNFVSVVVILIFLVIRLDRLDSKRQFLIKGTVKLIILSTLILYPYYKMQEYNALEGYTALEKVKESETGAKYLNILEWIMVYEKFGYENLYKYLRPTS